MEDEWFKNHHFSEVIGDGELLSWLGLWIDTLDFCPVRQLKSAASHIFSLGAHSEWSVGGEDNPSETQTTTTVSGMGFDT